MFQIDLVAVDFHNGSTVSAVYRIYRNFSIEVLFTDGIRLGSRQGNTPFLALLI
ncbi:hypothetical protein HQN88_29760 [Paenibacillus qinlingensis]|nr:hypothetical protein [Paenibacillus qinlingensis]